tara:strand:- start:19 stop:309 length:291 start_codon:yes stop_codon:yes gene_type:complete
MILDHDAIRRAYPTVTFIDDKGSVIQDESGNSVTIEQSKVDAARVTLDAEFEALDYARNRAAEYPSMVDQLDKMFHSGFQAWKDEIQKVKEKYPKP